MNEGLHALDVMIGLSVQSRTVSVEPASPAAGHAYILRASPSGAEWSTFEETSFAVYSDGAWLVLVPPEGTRAWVEDESTLCVFTSNAWTPLPIGAVTQLGINTSASTANRLAVKSDAVLFSHDDVTPVAATCATPSIGRRPAIPDPSFCRLIMMAEPNSV